MTSGWVLRITRFEHAETLLPQPSLDYTHDRCEYDVEILPHASFGAKGKSDVYLPRTARTRPIRRVHPPRTAHHYTSLTCMKHLLAECMHASAPSY